VQHSQNSHICIVQMCKGRYSFFTSLLLIFYRSLYPTEEVEKTLNLLINGNKISSFYQIRLQYIYTWECHKETPCEANLKQAKVSFFWFSFYLYKIREQEGGIGPAWGIWYQWQGWGGGGEMVNMVQILCAHICKWKNDIC
jgi:hypothetical protein